MAVLGIKESFDSLMKVLGAGLSIWEHHEKTKYKERAYELQVQFNEEFAKPLTDESGNPLRDEGRLVRIYYKLRSLGDYFASEIGR